MAGRAVPARVGGRAGRAGQCGLPAQRQVPQAPAQTRRRWHLLAGGFHASLAVRAAGQPSPGPPPAAARLLRRWPGIAISDPGTRRGRRKKEECRMMKGLAKPPKARCKSGTSQVIGRGLGGDWEVQARYMRGACEVQAGVLRQCPNGPGRDKMPRTVSICWLCRQLRTLLARYSPRWGMRIVPSPRVTLLAGCSWRAAGQPPTQKGRPNNEPPLTNPQPRVPQPILIGQSGPECIQTWRTIF
jgi:hypothetical protein